MSFTASATKGNNYRYWKWNQLFLTAVKTRVETKAAVVSFKQLCLHVKQKLDKTLMHKSYSPRAFKWLSAPGKACAEFYYHQIADKFSLKFPWCITNAERLILYRLVCCLFWSVFECLVPLFNKLIELLLTYRKFANPSKPRCWVKLGTLHQSKLRCCGKLSTLHQAKPRLWCSNYRYREFPQTFSDTIETFWVVFGLPAPHSGFLVSALYKHTVL